MNFDMFEKQPVEKQERIIITGIREFSRKAYKDVSTDTITRDCAISKGLLFHYFGSKKEFYLYCLNHAIKTFMEQTVQSEMTDFTEILFSFMDQKIRMCREHSDEMRFINMASRESASEIAEGIKQMMIGYRKIMQQQSMAVMNAAMKVLPMKNQGSQRAVEGLLIYTNAVIQKYLLQYQETPDLFFENAEQIKSEIREYLDLMLYGICNND